MWLLITVHVLRPPDCTLNQNQRLPYHGTHLPHRSYSISIPEFFFFSFRFMPGFALQSSGVSGYVSAWAYPHGFFKYVCGRTWQNRLVQPALDECSVRSQHCASTSGQCQELASALLKNINAPTEMRMSACERPHAQDLGGAFGVRADCGLQT